MVTTFIDSARGGHRSPHLEAGQYSRRAGQLAPIKKYFGHKAQFGGASVTMVTV
jgi:hypothetical protein